MATFVDQIVAQLSQSIRLRMVDAVRQMERDTTTTSRRRGPGRPRRPLNMQCRVDGCRNRSRGPRFGFICDEHRSKLSKKEQRVAREKWREQHKKAA